MNEIIGIIVASVICWLNFVIIDTYFGLPQQPWKLKGFRLLEIQLKNEMEILLVDFSKEIFYVLLMLLPVH